MITRPVRVGLVGPLLGDNPGWVVSQGEVLAQRLRASGHEVRATSSFPARLPRLADTVSSMIRWRNDVDLFVVMVFSGAGFAMAEIAAAVARAARVPVVLHLHGGNLPRFASRHPRRVRRLLRGASFIVAPSAYLATELKRFGVDITTIPNVLSVSDVEFHERSHARARLLWMRTFHPHYNPCLAVDVLHTLHRVHPALVLTMAGQEKGLLGEVRSRAKELGLEERVRFPGFLNASGKREAFASHDIYLNTNHVDNTPVSVLEAAAAGLAIVATSVGGIPHLLEHERSALLVPDGDVPAMAAAVDRLLTDPDLVRTLSRNAYRVAAPSDWAEVGALWERVFCEVLSS